MVELRSNLHASTAVVVAWGWSLVRRFFWERDRIFEISHSIMSFTIISSNLPSVGSSSRLTE